MSVIEDGQCVRVPGREYPPPGRRPGRLDEVTADGDRPGPAAEVPAPAAGLPAMQLARA